MSFLVFQHVLNNTLYLIPFHSHDKEHAWPPCHLSLTRLRKTKKRELCPGAKFEAICFNQSELLSKIARTNLKRISETSLSKSGVKDIIFIIR